MQKDTLQIIYVIKCILSEPKWQSDHFHTHRAKITLAVRSCVCVMVVVEGGYVCGSVEVEAYI